MKDKPCACAATATSRVHTAGSEQTNAAVLVLRVVIVPPRLTNDEPLYSKYRAMLDGQGKAAKL